MCEKDNENQNWQATVSDLFFLVMMFGMKDWPISENEKEVEE